MELYALVIYDITDDGLRNDIAAFLKAQGLTRIQKSAFIGPTTPGNLRNIEAGVRRLIRGFSNVNVQIYLLTHACFNSRIIIGDLRYEEGEEGGIIT